MLKAHLAAIEKQLLAISQIPANAGHMLHRGTPREAFIKEFLTSHLSSRLAIGTGEIIDADSKPRESRNQFDIVLYDTYYPKIDLGGGVSVFLAESVVATIEVKSLLTSAELSVAVQNAARAKRLKRHMTSGVSMGSYLPAGIISIVVAYAGPANMSTVYNWFVDAERQQSLNQNALPPTHNQRITMLSESLELVTCLGLGTIAFDTIPLTVADDALRGCLPFAKRQWFSSADANLLWLFLLLVEAGANIQARGADLNAYVKGMQITGRFDP